MRMEYDDAYDDAAWERSNNIFDDFKKKVISHDVLLAVINFTAGYRDWVRPVDRARIADLGAFNLRKVRNEVAVMTFLKQNTHIPVPNIIHHGMRNEGPAGLGPFILMEYVAHASNLATQIRAPGYKRDDRPFLDPNIEEEKLEGFLRSDG
ncbi:hypothetical protein PENFLA_c014G04114 [Penicillium flavigenum]|uniref:Uncharacterized protein n=1 Tax=Penicillium flavigenum TaxID=254877 RepID=A0A1V6T5I0_9EURO|nr:hypothetical protein PENFLA_c014G04114 [Penicillium flavigenum]